MFLGAGLHSDEAERIERRGHLDLYAGVVLPEALHFMELEDQILSEHSKVTGVECGIGQAELNSLEFMPDDLTQLRQMTQMRVIRLFGLVHLAGFEPA
jgi:hypothetical protein